MDLEKIKRLAEQALSAPDPQPPTPAAPRAVQAAAPVPAHPEPVSPTPATTPARQAVSPPAANPQPQPTKGPGAHTSDTDLALLIEDRERKLNKRWSRYRHTVSLIGVALLASGAAVYSSSPAVREAIEGIAMDIRNSKDDVKSIGSVMGTFDEQLEQVAVRGEHIDAATQQLGVDPNSVTEADDLHMEAEMHQLMGDDAPTVSDSAKTLQSSLGIIQTAAGRDGKFDKKKEAPPTPAPE